MDAVVNSTIRQNVEPKIFFIEASECSGEDFESWSARVIIDRNAVHARISNSGRKVKTEGQKMEHRKDTEKNGNDTDSRSVFFPFVSVNIRVSKFQRGS